MIEAIVWAICVLLITGLVLWRLPVLLGVVQYKKLVLLYEIQTTVYNLGDLLRSASATDEDYERIYKTLISPKGAFYDLHKVVCKYKQLYPSLKEVELTKINKKAKNIDEKKRAIYNYGLDFNNIITTIMTEEHFRTRENLQALANYTLQIFQIFK
jgi:hypothetical protein